MLTWIRNWWGLPARTSNKLDIHRNRLDALDTRVTKLETAEKQEVVMTGRTVKIERRLAKNGEYYFVLLGGNGEVVVASETYDSKSNCDRARDWLLEKMRNGVAELSEE